MEQIYELNLRDYWGIFLKRKWEILISFLVIFLSMFIYTALQTPIYRATVLIKIEPPATYLIAEKVLPQRGYYPSAQYFQMADYVKQIVSRPILELAIKELGLIKESASSIEKDDMTSMVSDSIGVTEMQGTNMLQLTTQSDKPHEAADISNKIAEVFKRLNAEQENEQVRNVRVFIENTLKDVSVKLKDQDERVRVLVTQGTTGSAVSLVAQVSELEKKLQNLSTKFTENHPEVLTIKEEIAQLKAQMKSIPPEEFEYGILMRDKTINENLYNSLKQQLQEAKIKEAEKIDNVMIINPAIVPRKPYWPNKTKNYTMGFVLGLFLSITMALVIEHLDTSIGKVDDIENFIKIKVVGIIPYCPSQHHVEVDDRKERRRFRIFSARRKRSPEKEVLPYTYKPSATILELDKSEESALFMEAFRLLGVNLQLLFGIDGKIKNKIIMITSSKPEEGKTVIVSALGVAMAQMGYKVIVIDTDVRRAHIHKNYGLKDKDNGFTDILTGKINVDSAIRTATDIMLGTTSIDKIIDKPWLNNLNIMTAGSTFPNTITLFNSNRLNETLDYLRNKYDVVLIDTSPILAVSEPSILVPKVDGLLLVYRAGSTSRLALRRAKLQLESIKGKATATGVILNNVTPEIGVDSYYYYHKKYYREKIAPKRPSLFIDKKEAEKENV